MKKVEILYFEGCPNHRAAVALVRRAARELGVEVDLEEVEVSVVMNALRLRRAKV